MPLSWNEIKNRAVAFSKEWKGTFSEDVIYSKHDFSKDTKRIEFLFVLNEKDITGFFVEKKKKISLT